MSEIMSESEEINIDNNNTNKFNNEDILNSSASKPSMENIELMRSSVYDEFNLDLFKYNNPEEKRIYTEGLNNYYRLKSDYNKNIQKEKLKLIEMNVSLKKKKKLYKEFKPKCINCKQTGGTVFDRKFNTEKRGVVLTAKCGNTKTPCNLDIIINLGYIYNIENQLEITKNMLEHLKQVIIKEKNDLIYGYIDSENIVELFNETKENFANTMYSFELYNSLFLNQTDNFDKNNRIIELKASIYDDIAFIKNYIRDFNKTENLQFVRDAVELYINELYSQNLSNKKSTDKMNLIEEFTKLEWPVNIVEFNPTDNTYHLVQRHYKKDSLEYNESSDFGVEKYVVGTGEKIKKKKLNKTIKKTTALTNKKNKTQKFNIIMESDESEEKNKIKNNEERNKLLSEELSIDFSQLPTNSNSNNNMDSVGSEMEKDDYL